mmetsp:Transcript_12049/g.12440  ORF Transcript_12049/g.12440 Transcript_12049/m.12440 type:complete len:596 (-) Transcript_12049:291-2078(-)
MGNRSKENKVDYQKILSAVAEMLQVFNAIHAKNVRISSAYDQLLKTKMNTRMFNLYPSFGEIVNLVIEGTHKQRSKPRGHIRSSSSIVRTSHASTNTPFLINKDFNTLSTSPFSEEIEENNRSRIQAVAKYIAEEIENKVKEVHKEEDPYFNLPKTKLLDSHLDSSKEISSSPRTKHHKIVSVRRKAVNQSPRRRGSGSSHTEEEREDVNLFSISHVDQEDSETEIEFEGYSPLSKDKVLMIRLLYSEFIASISRPKNKFITLGLLIIFLSNSDPEKKKKYLVYHILNFFGSRKEGIKIFLNHMIGIFVQLPSFMIRKVFLNQHEEKEAHEVNCILRRMLNSSRIEKLIAHILRKLNNCEIGKVCCSLKYLNETDSKLSWNKERLRFQTSDEKRAKLQSQGKKPSEGRYSSNNNVKTLGKEREDQNRVLHLFPPTDSKVKSTKLVTKLVSKNLLEEIQVKIQKNRQSIDSVSKQFFHTKDSNVEEARKSVSPPKQKHADLVFIQKKQNAQSFNFDSNHFDCRSKETLSFAKLSFTELQNTHFFNKNDKEAQLNVEIIQSFVETNFHLLSPEGIFEWLVNDYIEERREFLAKTKSS